MTIESNESPQRAQMRLYWAAGRTRELPGDQNRAGLSDIVHQASLDYANAIVGPATAVTLGWMKKTTFMIRSNSLGLINNAQVISDIIDAEDEGFDVAMIGPNWDPGLRAAREAVTIPVAGPGESSMMVARTLGARFAYLTVKGYGHLVWDGMKMSGADEHAIAYRPVREFLPLGALYESVVSCVEGRSDQFLVELEKAAKECIADGADVIIAGGQFFGPALLAHKFVQVPGTRVPVVDSTACGLKMAEMLAGLRQRTGLEKSQHESSPYQTPPREAIDRARREFGLIPAA